MFYDDLIIDLEKLKAVLAAMETEVNAEKRLDVMDGLVLVAWDIVVKVLENIADNITCKDLVVK